MPIYGINMNVFIKAVNYEDAQLKIVELFKKTEDVKIFEEDFTDEVSLSIIVE